MLRNANFARPRYGASVGPTVVALAMVVFIVGLIVYFIARPSVGDLLKAEKLTPSQIRTVATRYLVSDDYEIQADAHQKLLEIGRASPAEVVPIFANMALNNKNIRVRGEVTRLIASIDVDAADKVLRELVESDREGIRGIAVNLAINLVHPPPNVDRQLRCKICKEKTGKRQCQLGIEVLMKGLDDSDPGVRALASGSFTRKKHKPAIAKLERLWADKQEDFTVRSHAARSLQALNPGKIYPRPEFNMEDLE